jgi:hypothetical protein
MVPFLLVCLYKSFHPTIFPGAQALEKATETISNEQLVINKNSLTHY